MPIQMSKAARKYVQGSDQVQHMLGFSDLEIKLGEVNGSGSVV